MPKVFIPEPKMLNEKAAAIYGSIVPLLPPQLRLGLEPDRIKLLTAKSIGAFDENEDFLLLDGSPVNCAVVFSLLLIERNSLNLLLWDTKSGRYFSRLVSFENLPTTTFSSSEKRVFAANDVHDMSQVKFPVISLSSGMDPDILEPDHIFNNMIKILATSQLDDMLLISGSKIHNCIASGIISKMHEKVNYLIFDAVAQRYVLRSCTFSLEGLMRICTGL